MVLRKRFDYGFNGYQVPPTPRAARSARRRGSSWKKAEGNTNTCAFDFLATVAGTLMQEGDNSADKSRKDETEEQQIKAKHVEREEEENRFYVDLCDQGSCNRSFFVSEIISQAPNEVNDCLPHQNDSYSGPASGITSEKVVYATFDFSLEKVKTSRQVRSEAPNDGKPWVIDSFDSCVKLRFCKDHSPCVPLPLCQDNVDLVTRDNDENSSWCTQPPTTVRRPPPRIGDRRIRRLLASKHCNTAAPNVEDDFHVNADAELKPVYGNRKFCYKRQRSLRDYPFKKRKLYELEKVSDSDGRVSSDDRSSSPRKESVSGSVTKSERVKLKITSFRVPELFIDIPETATVGSLKRMVIEAVTAILGGELHVGMTLQGKKIRDDNKTLLQIGICHDSNLDALCFSLEPNQMQVPSSLCPQDPSLGTPLDMPMPVARCPPANSVVVQHISHVPLDPCTTNLNNLVESDHDSAPYPHDMSVDSRALVSVPAMNTGALTVHPMRKSKRAEDSPRRIRRPFSVSEVEALVQAVEKLGTGRWRDVKLRAFDNAKHRTYVDLKFLCMENDERNRLSWLIVELDVFKERKKQILGDVALCGRTNGKRWCTQQGYRHSKGEGRQCLRSSWTESWRPTLTGRTTSLSSNLKLADFSETPVSVDVKKGNRGHRL